MSDPELFWKIRNGADTMWVNSAGLDRELVKLKAAALLFGRKEEVFVRSYEPMDLYIIVRVKSPCV